MPPVTGGGDAGGLRVSVGTADPGEGWDAFVATHPNGHLMQSRAWAGLRRDTGWKPFFLSLEEGGNLRGAALCLQRPIPATGLSLLYIPRGPVLEYNDHGIVEAFRVALRQLVLDVRAFVVHADPAVPEDRQEAHRALQDIGFRREEKQGLFRIAQPRRVMRIPLERYGGPEGLRTALPHKTRYNISLAERKGVVVYPRIDRDALRIFHQMLWTAGRRKAFPVRGFRYHEAIWQRCVQAGLGEYLFAEHNGRILAAIQILRFGRTAWYMYGASGEEDRNLMPAYLLQWVGITRAWTAGCGCYDMRGVYSKTPRPEDPEYGVYDFKQRFNAEMVTFIGEYDLVVRPCAYATWRLLERATQRPAAWGLWLWNRLRVSA